MHLALNRAFKEPLEAGELEFLEGSRIRIRITDAHVDWLIEAVPGGFEPVDRGLELKIREKLEYLRERDKTSTIRRYD